MLKVRPSEIPELILHMGKRITMGDLFCHMGKSMGVSPFRIWANGTRVSPFVHMGKSMWCSCTTLPHMGTAPFRIWANGTRVSPSMGKSMWCSCTTLPQMGTVPFRIWANGTRVSPSMGKGKSMWCSCTTLPQMGKRGVLAQSHSFPLISRAPEDSLIWTSVRHSSFYGTVLYLTYVLIFFYS
jgi:hypothetical protein